VEVEPSGAHALRWPTTLTKSARAVQLALYLLLFILPVLGWINASFRGFTVSFFGLFELPALVQNFNRTGDVHAFSSNYVLLAAVGLHVLAVLHHALIRKDRLLQRMLPSIGHSGRARPVGTFANVEKHFANACGRSPLSSRPCRRWKNGNIILEAI
jgi:Prokaryotic cytochrome b561